MNRDDVLDVLSVVAAATRRTIGETDVQIWDGIIGELDKADAIAAVREHFKHRPGVWLEPGHVYQQVRAWRRDQLERESEADRDVRYAALDTKAADEVRALAVGVTFGPVNPTARLGRARAALQTCHGETESKAAIREFLAAKAAAK